MSAGPLLIVNPASGGGRTGRTFEAMREPIERALGKVDVLYTERTGHAIELAQTASSEGRGLIVAVGGDGTFSEVVGGVASAGSKETQVGLIAQGTGGDFRRTLGLEHRLDRYLEAIASGRTRAIDVGKITFPERAPRYFVNVLSAGMGGLVDQYVQQSKVGSAKTAYFLASLRAMITCARGRLRLKLSRKGEVREEKLGAYVIAICNGRYFGAGMKIAPDAAVDDGLFEVVAMDAGSKLAFTTNARRIYDGRHIGTPGVKHFTCDKIELTLENTDAKDVFLLDVDGEALGPLPISVEVVPRAITLRG